MERILYLAHTETDGSMGKAALETLTAASTLAKDLQAELVLGLFGGSTEAATVSLEGTECKQAFAVEGEAFISSRYATDAAAIEALCRKSEASFVVAPGNARINRVLAGVCQRLGGRIDTHVTAYSIEAGTLQTKRWYYRQRMEAEQTRTQRPWFIAIDPGTFTPWTPQGDAPSIEKLSVEAPSTLERTTVEGFKTPEVGEQTIKPDATLLFVAGAGWTKKQGDGQIHVDTASNLILDLLHKGGASLGGSKSVVDLSGEKDQAVLPFMTHLNQIGQTGATPRHPKGLSTCCHGEEPHVIGWRFVNERRAVNLDANCGWAQGKADILYVADAFKVMAKLNELL